MVHVPEYTGEEIDIVFDETEAEEEDVDVFCMGDS